MNSERNYNYIFSKLVQSDDDIVGLISYALYKRQKIDHIQRFMSEHGHGPTDENLKSFHEMSSTDIQIENYRTRAEKIANTFINELMADFVEEFKKAQYEAHKKAEKEAILEYFSGKDEVFITKKVSESKKHYWRDSALSGIVGNLSFIIAIAFLYKFIKMFGDDYPGKLLKSIKDFFM